MLRLAVIGLGHRVMHMCKVMHEVDASVQITGLLDPNADQIKTQLEEAKLLSPELKILHSPEEIVANRDAYDGIVIGTRCLLHTPMAVAVAKANLPLFLEKPVSITRQEVEDLAKAYQGRESSVLVSFPLRITPLFQETLAIVQSGRLGVINQIQAFNNVSYGDVYYYEWYRDFTQNGGLWLQKATHDVDYINLLAQSTPVSVAAMISRRVYDTPDAVAEITEHTDIKERRPDCPVNHQDAGSAIIMYDNGVHATYCQNFVSKKSAGRRGATIIGHRGTAEFNWGDHTLRVVDHFKNRVDCIEVKPNESGHGGGDHKLARNFIDMMKHQAPAEGDLRAGILSATICLAARESANTHTYQPIVMPGEPAPRVGPRGVEQLST